MAKQDVTVELFYGSVWNDHTADVLVRDEIEITRGRADESSQPAPDSMALTFKGWQFNPRNPASDLFGLIGRNTPIRVLYPAGTRFIGEVASWTPRQSLGGPNIPPDRWVEVVAAGITRRLGQGADPLRDTLYRWIPGTGPDAWWPLDDPADARAARSLVAGVPPLRPSGESRYQQPGTGIPVPAAGAPQFAGGDMGPRFAAPFTSLQAGGELAAGFTVHDTGASIAYRVEFTLLHQRKSIQEFVGNAISRDVVRVEFDGGDLPRFDVNFTVPDDPDNFAPQVRVFGGDIGNLIIMSAEWFMYDGLPHRYGLDIERLGADVSAALYIDGVQVASDTAAGVTLGPLAGILVNRLDSEGDTMPHIGHLVVWQSFASSAFDDSTDAGRSYDGEAAGARIARLCGEEGVPLDLTGVAGDLDETASMGPQHPDGFLALLRECADTDLGILEDRRSLSGELRYRTRLDLYNQTPGPGGGLALDYDAAEVAPPLDPVTDDQATRNDVTVTRRNGTAVRRVDQDGPVGVTAVGRYNDDVTVNVASDAHLPNQAGWRLHLGTTDDIRWPRVALDLTDDAALAGLVDQRVQLGDRITIANLPPELSPDLANLMVQGWTETIGSHTRKITFNCTPEEPYHIAEVEHAEYSIIGSDGSHARTSPTGDPFVSGTDTALFVVTPGIDDAWTDEAAPFDILVSGVRLRVTAVADVPVIANGQEFTVQQQPVNGVIKTVVDTSAGGPEVDVFHKSYIGL